jgi:DNA-binding FrmR family transcriptional regulator
LLCGAFGNVACLRPKPANRASFANIAHLHFRASRQSVSVEVSDPLDGIAYPNAAAVTAIVLDVLRRHQPGPFHPAGITKGATAHLLSVQSSEGRELGLDIPIANPYTVPPTPWNPEVSTVSHTKSEKEKLLNRVKRVRGQIEAVERALEEEKGCSTVLHLIVAARGAMSSLMTEVIEDHIRLHVVDPIKGTERVRGAEELIEAVQAYLK